MIDKDSQQVGQKRSLRQRVLKKLPLLTHAEQVTVYKQMRNNARADVDFFSMILLSASIAYFGLLQNSAAVIIGAMLVAPLMSPMIAIGGLVIISLALMELCLDQGGRQAADRPELAAGCYLAAAQLAFAGVDLPALAGQPPSNAPTVTDPDLSLLAFNHSTGQIARLLFDSKRNRTEAATIAGPWQRYHLQLRIIGDAEVSDSSEGPRGKLGNLLIEDPTTTVIGSTLPPSSGMTESGIRLTTRKLTSITSLEPHSPELAAILKQNLAPDVTFHSVIGRKSKTGPLANSSDGTVAYWSSHLEGARSETIVNGRHTPMVKHPDTIEELRRLLYEHAGIT